MLDNTIVRWAVIIGFLSSVITNQAIIIFSLLMWFHGLEVPGPLAQWGGLAIAFFQNTLFGMVVLWLSPPKNTAN